MSGLDTATFGVDIDNICMIANLEVHVGAVHARCCTTNTKPDTKQQLSLSQSDNEKKGTLHLHSKDCQPKGSITGLTDGLIVPPGLSASAFKVPWAQRDITWI